MPRTIERIAHPDASLGTRRELVVHRYGRPDARPFVYLQAGLHADELPGCLVLHHLSRRLDEADAAGGILGSLALVPLANPIGLSQALAGRSIGRYELPGGDNFNRNFPDLAAPAASRLDGRLGPDPAANVAAVRAVLASILDEMRPLSEVRWLRRTLMRLAVEADAVIDLHCDFEAEMHLYTGDHLWPAAAPLAAELGCRACLLAAESGGMPFDEAFSTVWWRLADRYGGSHPVPRDACLSATVELRGQADVDDALAAGDAAALFRWLQRFGVLSGDPGPLPELLCDATPLSAVDVVRSPAAGVLAFPLPVGSAVTAGQVIAEVVDPAAADAGAARVPLRSGTSGILLTRTLDRLARPGQAVAKVAGTTPLPTRTGMLLED